MRNLPLHALQPLARFGPASLSILDDICCDALKREVDAWPKPGLVTPQDSGSHQDMDHACFMTSISALRGYFASVAAAGACGAAYKELQPIAIAAEMRMLEATQGANTHRGAIFNLGLLVAAAALRQARPEWVDCSCGSVVSRVWGGAILASRNNAPVSHGASMWRRHAVGGARAEAAAGFPAVYDTGLPMLRQLLAVGEDEETALIGTLMALMGRLHDTNLLWRGGKEGLHKVQAAAAAFNQAGGVRQAGWRKQLVQMHAWMVRDNLSPGGSADLTAATWLLYRMESG